MFFSKKNKQQQQLDVGQKFFKYAAFFFLVFVLYQMYASDLKGRLSKGAKDVEQAAPVTQGEVNQQIQTAFDKMNEDPEYKKIKDFVEYINKSVDKKKGTALKAPEGYLIFVPFDLIFKDNSVPDNKILVHSDEVEFYIDYKIVQKILENPSLQDKAQAVGSDIGEIKSDVDSAEYNRLMEEIAEKNGVKYVPEEKKADDKDVNVAPEQIKNDVPEKPQNKTVEKLPATGAAKQQPQEPSKQAK